MEGRQQDVERHGKSKILQKSSVGDNERNSKGKFLMRVEQWTLALGRMGTIELYLGVHCLYYYVLPRVGFSKEQVIIWTF